MDFNDLDAKLKRLYVALGERYDQDISSNITDSLNSFGDGRFEHRVTFGKNKPEENENVIMNAIHLIGSLKDIIKAKLQDSDQEVQMYEDLINDNLALALITDLDNKDKHGDPLTHSSRSNKNPKIVNIQQGLRGKGITRIAFKTDLLTGETTLSESKGDLKIVTFAEVVDSEGNILMPFDKMLDESLELVEKFLKSHNLLNIR